MPEFVSVAATRGIDQIVEQIRAAIQDGRLADNARLPSERELAARFEVSRGVIREAIKILNGMGLVESRQGAGIYVTSNPTPLITRALTISFKPEPEMVDQLFEIRVALETLAIRTAVRDASDEDLRRLESYVPTEEDGDAVTVQQASDDDTAFHLAIAEISGNPYLQAIAQAVRGVLVEAFPITELQREGIRLSRRAHKDIAQAMLRRDGDLAVELLLEHVGGTHLATRKRSGGGQPSRDAGR
jgi:GntR family transcriptional repressor for pyruvate dehydrogenase complex